MARSLNPFNGLSVPPDLELLLKVVVAMNMYQEGWISMLGTRVVQHCFLAPFFKYVAWHNLLQNEALTKTPDYLVTHGKYNGIPLLDLVFAPSQPRGA